MSCLSAILSLALRLSTFESKLISVSNEK
jgi:hypothetical protein